MGVISSTPRPVIIPSTRIGGGTRASPRCGGRCSCSKNHSGGVETDRVPLYIQTTQITGQSFQKIPLNRQEAIRRSIPDKEHSLWERMTLPSQWTKATNDMAPIDPLEWTGKTKRDGRDEVDLEPMDLYGLSVEFEPFFLINQKFLDILALIPLELDHLAHLTVVDDGAIASELLLNDLEDLLLVELFRETLNSCQSLTTIALLNPYMDIILGLFCIAGVFVSFGEGVEGLEVFD